MAQPISVKWCRQMTPHAFKSQPLSVSRMEIGRSVCLDPRGGTIYRRMSDSLPQCTPSRLRPRNIFFNKPTRNDILNSVSWNSHKQLDLLRVCVCVWERERESIACGCLSCDFLFWYSHCLFLFFFLVMCHRSSYEVGTLKLNNKLLLPLLREQSGTSFEKGHSLMSYPCVLCG